MKPTPLKMVKNFFRSHDIASRCGVRAGGGGGDREGEWRVGE